MMGVVVPTGTAMRAQHSVEPLGQKERQTEHHDQPIVIVGGGVSGIWSALTLKELGYTNVTILERELRVGGKASAFEYDGQKYPLGAVGTPLALEEASFTESQLLEKPGKFAARLLGKTGRRLRLLNANNLVLGKQWPQPFPTPELTAQTPVHDWQRAFGASGKPERFYAHQLDFSAAPELASAQPLSQLVPRWGRPQTAWPLVYVSAHGYGVAEASDAPPFYYWARFAQKSTNAGAKGPMAARPVLGHGPIGPKGPALRGWDTTSLFERKLREAGVHVRGGVTVTSIRRDEAGVTVATAEGGAARYDGGKLVLAIDLEAALPILGADASDDERDLFSRIRHQPYYTVASFMRLPWLATNSVYYLGDHQAGAAADAGRATAGCPTILLKPQRRSNLTVSWAYGGDGIGPAQMEACLRSTVERLGGTFGGVLFVRPWRDYFPHVSGDDLRANYHRRLDALQGRRRTYMVGELFNLPLVSECVDWARYLIRRHFAPGASASSAAPTAVQRSPSLAAV